MTDTEGGNTSIKEKNHLNEMISIRAKKYSALNMAVASPPSPAYVTVRDEINAMLIKDIRQELDSYGIPNKSFFEKKELVEALVKARQEEWIHDYETTIGTDTTAKTTTTSGSSFAENDDNGNTASKKKDKSWFKEFKDNMVDQFSSNVKGIARKERIKLEMAKLKDVKVKELKQELESYGVSTKSYFEKSEFVREVAKARVDGVNKKAASRTASSSSRGNRDDEVWDPSYNNVFVKRFDASTIDQSGMIDVRAR